MIVPFSTEVLIRRWPWGNIALIVACIGVFVLLYLDALSEGVVRGMILTGWRPAGLIGHLFLHGDFWHLLFNMLFLWTFGNAVGEKTGSLAFVGLFLLFGFAAAAAHIVFDGSSAIGASGAVNGIIGFYLALYPVNRVRCFYWIFLRPGTFEVAGFVPILLWLGVDLLMVMLGVETGIAYWAHIGGFAAGLALGVVALSAGWVRMEEHDNPSMLDLFVFRGGRRRRRLAPATARRYSAPSPAPRPTPLQAPERTERGYRVPAPPAALAEGVAVECPHCGQRLWIPLSAAGGAMDCLACKQSFSVLAE